jgi:hypothetical protein
MSDMDELIAWLLQQLDEDEGLARQAFAGHNDAIAEWHEPWSGAVEIGPREDDLICNDSGVSRHIVNWDPARVLAEVEAKRRILELHEPIPSQYVGGRYVGRPGDLQCSFCASLCHSSSGLRCEDPDAPWPCETVNLLAQAYAGQLGWREEWRANSSRPATRR